MRNLTKANDKGMALVIALVMLLTLTIMGIAAITTSTVEIQIAGNERFSLQAMNLADAGVERALLDLLMDYKKDGNWGNSTFTTLSTGAQNTVILSGGFIGFPIGNEPLDDSVWGNAFAANPSVGSIVGNAVAPYGETLMGSDGYYTVLLLRDTASEIWARIYAEHPSRSRKIVQLHLKMEKVDAWHNAVFAGAGAATGAITGNINVNGPVHVLGQGEANPWAISGSSAINNGYKGLTPAGSGITAAEMLARLPAPEIVDTYDGQPVYSLGSVLRVKNAQVGVTGSGNIGDKQAGMPPDVVEYDGIYYKATVDAIYSQKDVTGAAVYADEKQMPDGYDLGDKVQLPTFEDKYDSTTQVDREGAPCAEGECITYKDYIEKKSQNVDGAANPARCTLNSKGTGADAGTPPFSVGDYDCGTPTAANIDTCNCTDPDGCMYWNPDPGMYSDDTKKSNLRVDGRVEFDQCPAGLKIGTNNKDVIYSGKGLLYSPGNVEINSSFMTQTKNPPPADGGDGQIRTFTEDDIVGIIAKGSMNLITVSGKIVMGGFFATETIGTTQAGSIIGSIVSNRFCMGPGVNLGTHECNPGLGGTAPNINYVDTLPDAVQALGMIKSKAMYSFKTYEWKEVF